MEAEGRQYNNMVLEDRISEAVNSVVDTDRGRLYQPEDDYSKTGRPVLDILREKYPEVTVPLDEHSDTYKDTGELLESMPVYCYAETVAKATAKLRGAPGPSGVNGLLLKSWCLRYDTPSEKLRDELVCWMGWLSNGLPDYVAYRALNAARMLAADKKLGLRPLACGEVFMCLNGDKGCDHNTVWKYAA